MNGRPVVVVLCAYVGIVEVATITVQTLTSPFLAQRYIDKLEASEPADIARLKAAIVEFVGHDVVSFYYLRKELP